MFLALAILRGGFRAIRHYKCNDRIRFEGGGEIDGNKAIVVVAGLALLGWILILL